MDWPRHAGRTMLGLLVLAAMQLGGPLQIFVHLPSAIVLGFGTLAAWGLLSGRALPSLRRTLAAPRPSPTELATARVTARAGRRALWSVTSAAAAVHLIQLMMYINDLSAIGPLIAALFLGPLYALLLDCTVLSSVEQAVVQKAASLGVADTVIDTAERSARPRSSRTQAQH
ncbi:MAG: hypothetical protein CL927_07175 [Deltaproteobacteria bacterium]|nr:hypothetical protein [Deltaproteobacteria bacterium]HCH61667.1 hypothetical protein [Deltaproteobacteria bacterium]